MLIGTRKDLLKFTCKPQSEKDLRRNFSLKTVLASPGRISKVSSAYYKMGKSPPKLLEIG
jgi:hypothetical protein